MMECKMPNKADRCDYSCRGEQGILCLLSKCNYKHINHEDYKSLMSSRSEIDVSKC